MTRFDQAAYWLTGVVRILVCPGSHFRRELNG